MVGRSLALSALIAACCAVPCIPVCAQDVMGQIEQQVAGVVSRSTNGVVAVEDARDIELNDAWLIAMRDRPRGLRHRMTDAVNRLSEADIQITVLKSAVKSSPALTEAINLRSAIAVELDNLKSDLAKSTDAARVRVDVDNGHIKWLTDKRTRLEDEITQLSRTLKSTSSRMAPLLATKAAISVQLASAQSQLAADERKLSTDMVMRPDIPKVGTGFCIGEGYIVTTADVLDGMYQPVAITTDGTRIRTHVVGIDNETNIGLLRLSADSAMPALALSDSNTAAVGTFAICIANQSGTQNTASLNTITGIRSDGMFSGRKFYPRLLQISGTIAVGNSGAPLLNSHGDVIGMVVAVPAGDWTAPAISTFAAPRPGIQPPATESHPQSGHAQTREGASGSSFRTTVSNAMYAMPMSCARPIVDDLRLGKPAQHCWIGISVSSQIKQNYNEKTLNLDRTVTVNYVYPDSPALKVGVQKGDQIISINGRPIREEVDVRIVSMLSRPGDKLEIVLVRSATGQTPAPMTLNATADLRPITFPRPTPPQNKTP